MALLQGNQGVVGKQTGQNLTAGFGEFADPLVSELQARFYEMNYKWNLYSIGCQLTALSAATILLTASGQPIVGVWNPPTSPVNLVLLQAMLIDELNNVTSVAPGAV